MGFEAQDKRLELRNANLERLREIMGDMYNPIEIEDYFSYVAPEDASVEIDGLEERLKKGRQDQAQIFEGFKAHISYVYAAR